MARCSEHREHLWSASRRLCVHRAALGDGSHPSCDDSKYCYSDLFDPTDRMGITELCFHQMVFLSLVVIGRLDIRGICSQSLRAYHCRRVALEYRRSSWYQIHSPQMKRPVLPNKTAGATSRRAGLSAVG
jgi:hypothetical protein